MKLNIISVMKEFRFLFNRLPFYLIFYPTSRCNARCPHCFNHIRQGSANSQSELSLDEIDKISKNFEHVKVLTITGGEPFLRGDLSEIVSIFHKHNGIQYVSFHTNAFLTKSVNDTISKVLNKFKDLEVIVCISIDGIGEAHNRFRGVEDGFTHALETIAKLKGLKAKFRNLNLIASTIFSQTTMKSFPDTINFIKGIGGIKPSLSFVRGNVKDGTERIVDYKAYEEFYKNFKPGLNNKISPFSSMAIKDSIEIVTNKIVVENYKNSKPEVSCQAGRKLVVIYENGDVYPCEALDDKFGNLRDVNYDIKKLVFSERAKQIMYRKKNCFCTWENIIPVNLLFNPKYYPRIFYEWLRSFILKNK